MAATAILNRFLQHADIITIKGRNYRLKDRARKEEEEVAQGEREVRGSRRRPDPGKTELSADQARPTKKIARRRPNEL